MVGVSPWGKMDGWTLQSVKGEGHQMREPNRVGAFHLLPSGILFLSSQLCSLAAKIIVPYFSDFKDVQLLFVFCYLDLDVYTLIPCT